MPEHGVLPTDTLSVDPAPDRPDPGAGTEQHEREPRRHRGGMVVVLVLAAALLLLAESGAGRGVLRAAGLSQQRTGYASLSLSDPAGAPTTLGPGNELDLRFALHSAETSTRSFTWSAATWAGGVQHPLAGGSVELVPGQTALIARTVHVPCTGRRVAVHVTLVGTSTGIDLWLACPRRR
ncbi:MAG TPA: hypothetical protein VMU75_11070 [Acidimicrobiales bacterium]|nr:hypothetical protein [Acidimicrobiales bacterium]